MPRRSTWTRAWRQSRYGKGDGADYINCPLDKAQYHAFVAALLRGGESAPFHDWEKDTPYFEGCLPIEVMAARGADTLRWGPMKPIGLTDPRTGRGAYAVVQLRQDNALGTLYNMVGFQTKLKHGEQMRIFRTIPGLERAEFARLGGLHRNTFLNSPRLLDATLRLKAHAAPALCRPDHRRRGLCRERRDRACSPDASPRPSGSARRSRRRRPRPRWARFWRTSPAAPTPPRSSR